MTEEQTAGTEKILNDQLLSCTDKELHIKLENKQRGLLREQEHDGSVNAMRSRAEGGNKGPREVNKKTLRLWEKTDLLQHSEKNNKKIIELYKMRDRKKKKEVQVHFGL